jgi:monoamine oxidase
MRLTKTKIGRWMQRCFHTAQSAHEYGKPVNQVIAERNKDYSRRNFIADATKLASVGIAVNGLTGCIKSVVKDQDTSGSIVMSDLRQQKKKIAIIGAGMAGLNAAITLQDNGIQADVYEASQRSGGRMLTSYGVIGNSLTSELGAEFINTDHAEMIRLVKKYNLDLIDSFDDINLEDTLYFNGRYFTEKDVAEEIVKFLPKIIADQQSLSVNINAFNNTETDRYFDQLTATQYLNQIGAKGWIRDLLVSLLYSEYGAHPDIQSSLNLLYLAFFEKSGQKFSIYYSDERFKIRGGNQQLTNLMAADLDNVVKYGYQLKKVKSINGKYRLTFIQHEANEINLTYDIVLFAIPFTILRDVNLEVDLPSWKREVIENLGYGNNSKLLMGFKNRFWRERGASGGYLTDNEAQSGWDNSLLQDGTTGGLTIYKGGEQAVILGNGTLEQQVVSQLPFLNEVFPGALKNFNGRAQRKVWPADPLVKASYTCYLAGQYTTLLGKQIIPIDNMYFAGEHCSIDYWGYMNGAAETGKLVAEKIAEKINL